jgi:hypothetical protein
MLLRDGNSATRLRRGLAPMGRTLILFATCALFCSCTLFAHSPYLAQRATIPVLEKNQGLITNKYGELPYQRWRVKPWDGDMRYIWLAGNYDFRKCDQVEMILYFHGMHSQDYYSIFRKELESLAEKRPDKPFIFVGYVDTPFVNQETQSRERWASLVPNPNERPDTLVQTVNEVFRALRTRFPQIHKEKTRIVLAGFSGGGKVLDSVGNWLANADKDDPWAEMFRSRLSKIVYFDCWFDKRVVKTVPALLESNPAIKIVGTVHMKKPAEHAAILAERYRMTKEKKTDNLTGADGRLKIFHNDSHWHAMIARLKDAL